MTKEVARTYRLVLNEKIASDEGTRRCFILREVRSCIEAQQAMADITPTQRPIWQLTVVAIPNGQYLTREECAATVARPKPFLTPAPPGMTAADVSAAIVNFPTRKDVDEPEDSGPQREPGPSAA